MDMYKREERARAPRERERMLSQINAGESEKEKQ